MRNSSPAKISWKLRRRSPKCNSIVLRILPSAIVPRAESCTDSRNVHQVGQSSPWNLSLDRMVKGNDQFFPARLSSPSFRIRPAMILRVCRPTTQLSAVTFEKSKSSFELKSLRYREGLRFVGFTLRVSHADTVDLCASARPSMQCQETMASRSVSGIDRVIITAGVHPL